MSYVERTAKKLLPILNEVKKRMIPDKKRKTSKDNKDGIREVSDSDNDEDLMIDLSKVKGNKNAKNK